MGRVDARCDQWRFRSVSAPSRFSHAGSANGGAPKLRSGRSGWSEAEDVVQEVLLAIHLKRQTWDVDRPIGPWIMAITRNKLIDARRRRGNRTALPIDNLADILTAEGSDDAMDRHDLDRLLDRLGDRQRDLVRSLSVEGRSVQETAERLDMSEGAVRVALHRAIKTLAALYRRGGR